MTTPALTTLASVKTYMQIADASRDSLISQLIPQVSQRIEKWCGRSFGSYEYTDYYSGDGTPLLVLRQRPVVPDGLRVWVDDTGYWGQGDATEGPFPASSELSAGEFALDLDDGGVSGSGLLYRVDAVWPMAKVRLWVNQSPELAADRRYPTGNVKVVYTAGELPDDVALAANMTVAAILQANRTGSPIQSEGYEDYSRTLASFATASGLVSVIPPQALSILADYRELSW
jgi:hypothetical protein